MAESTRTKQSTDDQSLFLMNTLVEQQKQFLEGSAAWFSYQAQINQIIAERFLQYLNR
jgi:hypothetical protein